MSVLHSPDQTHADRTETILRIVSRGSTVLALGSALTALGGWFFNIPSLRSVYQPWPPLTPGLALGIILCALGLMLQWSQKAVFSRFANVIGGVVFLGGLAGALPAPFHLGGAWLENLGSWLTATHRPTLPGQLEVTNNSVLILAGLALLRFDQTKRIWLGPSSVFGAILFAHSLFGVLTRLVMPVEAAPGVSGLGSFTALLLGIAYCTAHFNSGFINTLKSDNATGIVGRRLLILVAVLSPSLFLLQLRGDALVASDGLGQIIFTSMAFSFVLVAVLVFSLRRLERLDADKKHIEEERDRLLNRVQHQAALLQQEVSTRTKELKQLTERHHLALQSSNFGVWDWDVLSGEQIWDETMLKIFGLTPISFTGKLEDWQKRIHPDDLPRIQQLDWSALEQDDNLVFEYRIIRADGSIRQLRAQGQPQFSPSGRLIRVVGLARDETFEKEREVELSGLSERLQFVVSAAGYGVWEYDFTGDRLYWDDHLLKLHGLQRSEVHGGIETWRQRVHPEDWAAVQNHLNEVIAGRLEQAEPEYRIVTPDGSVRYMQMRSYLIRQSDGSPVRLVGLNRDVTAARELREQLRISEERWRMVIGSNNDAVWEWDILSDRYFHDQRFAEILGVPLSDLPDSNAAFDQLINPDDLEAANAALHQHLDGHSSFYQAEFRMRHRDGHWVWLLDRGKVVARDSRGKPVRMVGTQIDITTRKNLEEKLRHNEQLSLQLNRLAQIGAWDEDIATGRITWAPEVYRIHEVELGYTPSADSIERFYPPESRGVLEESFKNARLNGTPFDLELPFITARGHKLWIRILGQAESHLGKFVRLFGGFQDITARRDAEEMRRQLEGQLFQTQKMETLGTLAGGIAHDFNNLLTGILGYQDLAFDGLPEGHDSRPYLEASREASLRARELVDQILTFSRQTEAKKVPVDLKVVAGDAQRFLRSTVPATIRIEVNASPDCGLVLADVSQIHQVLLNLGSNASHAMRHTGGIMRITIYPAIIAETTTYNQLAPGNYVRLDFSDNGDGMDENTTKRIFDPFFTTKDIGQGTGLGLSMVHGILQAHQGTITVESAKGQGTIFSLYFPVAEFTEPAQHVVDVPPSRGRGELIAIVDDEDLVRSFAQISLERAGYQVVSFDRAATCLQEIRGRISEVSVLLTDQTMPGMNGMELAAEIRLLAPALPVIIMSGYYSRIAPETLQKVGHVSLISKPFTNEELSHAVHACLRPDSLPPFPLAP